MSEPTHQHDPGQQRAVPADGPAGADHASDTKADAAGASAAGQSVAGSSAAGTPAAGSSVAGSTVARGGRSPWTWAGAALILAALALGGVRRSFPFEPDGALGHWYVQAAIMGVVLVALVLGVWMVIKGYRGRASGDDVSDSLHASGFVD